MEEGRKENAGSGGSRSSILIYGCTYPGLLDNLKSMICSPAVSRLFPTVLDICWRDVTKGGKFSRDSARVTLGRRGDTTSGRPSSRPHHFGANFVSLSCFFTLGTTSSTLPLAWSRESGTGKPVASRARILLHDASCLKTAYFLNSIQCLSSSYVKVSSYWNDTRKLGHTTIDQRIVRVAL